MKFLYRVQMPALSRCLWLLLASACGAAPDGGPTHDYVLTPKSTNDPTTRLNQNDLGESPALGLPPPPPAPPMAPDWPKAPFNSAYWPVNYSDPNYVVPEPYTLCEPAEIEHSNRTGVTQCMDRLTPFPVEGTECFFECEPGYIAIGRHVCQWHDYEWINNNTKHTDPKHNVRGWLEQPTRPQNAFYGGRCQKLCGELADQTCLAPNGAPRGNGSGHTRRYPKSLMTSNITDGAPAETGASPVY